MSGLAIVGVVLGAYLAAAAVGVFVWCRAADRLHHDPDEPAAPTVPAVPVVELTGCTDPACPCREAVGRVLDRLADSGVMPGLGWTDKDDTALAELLGGA